MTERIDFDQSVRMDTENFTVHMVVDLAALSNREEGTEPKIG